MRKMQPKSFIDLVEDIHVSLVKDAKYRALLQAGYDKQTITGSLRANTILIRMIRDNAPPHSEVATAKLSEIRYALDLAMSRYHVRKNQT